MRSPGQGLEAAGARDHEFVQLVQIDHHPASNSVPDQGTVAEASGQGLGMNPNVLSGFIQGGPPRAPALGVGAEVLRVLIKDPLAHTPMNPHGRHPA